MFPRFLASQWMPIKFFRQANLLLCDHLCLYLPFQFMPVDRLSINAHIMAARQLDPQITLGCLLCLRSGSRTGREGLKYVHEAFGGRPWGGS
jgi:hypothetical protein